MKQKIYMIFYRPKGSITYTPVPDKAVARFTDRHANITASVGIADDIVRIMNSKDDGNEYVIFRCEETHVAGCGGGRVD